MLPLARSAASTRAAVLATVLSLSFSGCKSEYDRQVEQARATAATTGQAQQVISVDSGGKATVTIVQPSATPGGQPSVNTTTTPAGAPLVPGQPDWSNGARPSPGNTVTFAGPRLAAPAAPAVAGPGTLASGTVEPSPPVFMPTDVTIPSGTGLAIRINQTISVKHSHAGDHFSGELAESVKQEGRVVLPHGTRVNGIVTEAHRRGHFKGRSYLGLRLTSIAYQGKVYPIATGSLNRTKKGKGKRSSAFIGGGAGVGMLVGGLATGGVGLAIGGLAGGGLGTLLGGLTGNRDLQIPAETLVRFKLQDDLTVQPAE